MVRTRMNKTKIAIIYDFDHTLSKTNMQAPLIKMLGIKEDDFWDITKNYAKTNVMDNILSYLYCLIDECKRKNVPLNRDTLNKIGSEVEFYNGLDEWFDALDNLGKDINVTIEHFIISSGLKEIIEGTRYYKKFKLVYACEYHYDEYDKPVWIKNVVNFTTKTQLLFRINKGEFDIWDDEGVNEFVYHDERPYPFENIIYIGDGLTDIPCLKLVSQYGGHSIGVYNNKKNEVQKMMYDGRIDFYCKADYSKNKELYNTVEDIIREIRYSDRLRKKSRKQYKESENKLKEEGQTNIDSGSTSK